MALAYAAAHLGAAAATALPPAFVNPGGGRMRRGPGRQDQDDGSGAVAFVLILIVASLALWAWALVEAANRTTEQFAQAHHDKTIWLAFIVFAPFIGSLMFLFWARREIDDGG